MVELHIPSILGYERVAMDTTDSLARKIGFAESRVADLRTAVSEACLNAIEHGNRQDASVKVMVTLTMDPSSLQVDVDDRGEGILEMPEEPSIEEKVEGQESSRGWGMFLIQKLVDEVRMANEVAVISIEGDVTSFAEEPVEKAYQSISEGVRKVLLVFREGDHINSAGIAILIDLVSQSRKRDRKVCIAHPDEHFHKIFKMVGLTKYAGVFDSEAEGLASFSTATQSM